MAIPPTYHDSDADDEYERSVMTSPIMPTDDDDSPTDTDPPSTEPTPTAFGHHVELGKMSPANTIVGWTTDQCADYISSLGLSQYCGYFLENEIVGEALIALRHEELKEMGILSIGHRLTILKGVHDIKQKQGIPTDSDHWVPPSAEASALDQQATRDDIARIIRSLEIRDHRIQAAEAEIRKVTEEYRRLRDELLPIFRMAKDRSQPLPYHPQGASHSPDHLEDNGVSYSPGPGPPPPNESKPQTILSRKISAKRLFLGQGNPSKSSSPTYTNPTYTSSAQIADGSTLDPSAAAIAASNHLTQGMNGGLTTNDRGGNSQPSASPNQANMPSPTSPNTYGSNILPRSHMNYRSEQQPQQTPQTTARSIYSHAEEPSYSSTSTFTSDRDRDRSNPTPTPRNTDPRVQGRAGGRDPYFPSTSTINSAADNEIPPPSAGGMSSRTTTANDSSATRGAQSQENTTSSSGGPSVEIFKSFRVSMDDPCEKVLPAALKKYNINADWKNYALYIVYGDQERCLGLKEKPLILFKQLDREGKKPMFMLRKHASPMVGHEGPTGLGERNQKDGDPYAAGLGARAGMPAGGGGGGSIQLPGGVL